MAASRSSDLFHRSARPLWRAAAFVTAIVLLAINAPAAKAFGPETIMVNTDQINTIAGDGHCTLSEAINNANAGADTTSGDCGVGLPGATDIQFDAGQAVFQSNATINSTGLPAITVPVEISGDYPLSSNGKWVKVRGPGGSGVGFNFALGSAGSQLDHLIVDNWNDGVSLSGGGVRITNSRFGVDFNGTSADGNDTGIFVQSSNNVIGGLDSSGNPQTNVISGNVAIGVIVATGSKNVIQGNFIGPQANGNSSLVTSAVGMRLNGPAVGTLIGGSLPGQGNVISGNLDGIMIVDAQSTRIMRNFIGLGADGTTSLLNSTAGIVDDGGVGTVIGGSMPQSSNFIADNGDGIKLNGVPGSSTTIMGNIIGLDATGAAASNGEGIYFQFAPGKTSIKGNLIASNFFGVDFTSTNPVLSMSQNCITGNGAGTVNAGAAVTVKANWWGSATGPNTAGADTTSGSFVTAPWLTKPPTSCNGWGPKTFSPKDQFFSNAKTTPTTLVWSKVKTAARYDLVVTKDGLPFFSPGNLTSPSQSIGVLSYGLYSWQVRADSTDGVRWLRGARTFYVTIQKSPKPGGIASASPTVFTWNAYPGASSYSFALSTSSDCWTFLGGFNQPVVPGTSFSSNLASGHWYWSVKPSNGSKMPCEPFTVP